MPKTSVSNYIVLGNSPLQYIDPKGDNWFRKKTGKGERKSENAVWFEGSAPRKGYVHVGGDDDVVFQGSSGGVVVKGINKKRQKEFAEFRSAMWAFEDRLRAGVPTIQAGDNQKYVDLVNANLGYFQRAAQSEKDFRTMSFGAAGVLLGLPVLLETGILAGTDAFLWKMGLDGVGQTIVNGGDVSKLDLWDMTLAGFSAPGASAFYGGAIDIRLNGEVSMVGFNKSWQTAALDGTFKYAFGGKGLGGVPGSMLRKVTFSTPLSTLERDIVLRCLSVPISLSGKALRNAVKQNAGL